MQKTVKLPSGATLTWKRLLVNAVNLSFIVRPHNPGHLTLPAEVHIDLDDVPEFLRALRAWHKQMRVDQKELRKAYKNAHPRA